MVINLRLVDVTPIAPGTESMGRSWYGYDPKCTDVELWAQNRGRYNFNTENIEAERYATLSYRGEIIVVAELDDPCWEPFEDYEAGITKKALIGRVLEQGDPAHDALLGRTVGPWRGFTYLDDTEYGVDQVPPAAKRHTPPAQTVRSKTQGWQSDPIRRKLVEDAAQDRLMDVYRIDGWTVTDTRHGNSYDAVARRNGEVIFLEAKGTESDGADVIVTRGEVEHALAHPGQCVMGVLSEISITDDGQVDPDSGVFRLLPFEPEGDQLTPTGYRWELPTV